jgi:DNA-binding GntR family transcriptional regulator
MTPSGRRGTRVGHAGRIALHIRRMIFDGKLRRGDRVRQAVIARELGVSRIPVREALIGLEREGWVRIQLNRGATVNGMSARTVRDHFELIGMTYGLAARRAIEADADHTLVKELRRILQEIDSTQNHAVFTSLATEFQMTLVTASHSDRIPLVLQALSTIVPGDFFSLVPDAIPVERRSLKRIARAVAVGDGERAAAEYVLMMRRIGEIVMRLFAERGLLDETS